MLKFVRLSVVSLIALGLSTSAQAAKKKGPDLTAFKGVYDGTMVLTVVGFASYPGTARISIAVPKNGRSATVLVTGQLSVPGATLPFSNEFTFTSTKVVTVGDITYRVEGPSLSASGSYTASKKSLNFTVPVTSGGSSGTTSGVIAIHPKGKKVGLSVTTTLASSNSAPLIFTFDASRKVKAPK